MLFHLSSPLGGSAFPMPRELGQHLTKMYIMRVRSLPSCKCSTSIPASRRAGPRRFKWAAECCGEKGQSGGLAAWSPAKSESVDGLAAAIAVSA